MQLGARLGRRTGEAEVEDDDGASGAAVDDRCERGGRTTSALGVGARGGGDRGRRRGGAVELWAALRDGGAQGGALGWRTSGLAAQCGGGARSARPLVVGDGGTPGQRRRRAGGGGRRGRWRHERGGDQELTKCWRKTEEWEFSLGPAKSYVCFCFFLLLF
ncbi:hypothetical protein PVAP13_9NG377614 [Panicum virgatum]|uniref:Uncharacterized protein n=1 Tax=Panicum virgatum TaxID=38727 RepID=A0A8T0MPE9_PANVG|nr:hypothetical protein PVAP13_9NG377614 [Panicum virgatum]